MIHAASVSTRVPVQDKSSPHSSPPYLRWWWVVVGLTVSLFIQLFAFPPRGFSLLAFVCLTPWLVGVVLSRSGHLLYWGSYAMGLAMFLVNLSWFRFVTMEGYIAFNVYLAVYFPLAACAIRHLHRHWRIPLAISTPIVWVATEYLRAVIISGFPWLFLSHSQYRMLPLIQISDLIGAYGVSFVVAAVNGCVADVVIARLLGDRATRRFPSTSVAFTLLLVAISLGYGAFRLSQNTMTTGPRVAVIQRDFPLYVEGPDVPYWERAKAYFEYIDQLEDESVDIYLLPETPWYMFLNEEFWNRDPNDPNIDPRLAPYVRPGREYYEAFRDLAVRKNATVVVGALFRDETPFDLRAQFRSHNSAYVFNPDGTPPLRYDKVHCVYFGEVVPFRFTRLHFLYLWLNELSPFGRGGIEYSITPGSEFLLFDVTPASQPGRKYKFGVPICYEDVMPYVARAFCRARNDRKGADFLLNISNDGWFQHSHELTQHLVASVFRAVENRVGVARAVNTGISGFIDPDGRVHDLVTKDGIAQGPGVEGWRLANVMVDSRQSLYSQHGDVFAVGCTWALAIVYLDYLRVRARGNRLAEQNARPEPPNSFGGSSPGD